jgi:hypothetical protein
MPKGLNIHIDRGESLKSHDSSADGDSTVYIPVHSELCVSTSCNIATHTTDLYLVRFCLQLLCHMSNVIAKCKKISKI